MCNIDVNRVCLDFVSNSLTRANSINFIIYLAFVKKADINFPVRLKTKKFK